MYNETTRLVKVVMPESAGDGIVSGDSPALLASDTTADSGAIMLSDTAENLFIAYEVVAMVKDEETGKTHLSQLKWKKLGTVEDESESESESEETEPQLVYEFMFESGDKFVAYAADEYPALDGDELQMLSDDSSSGGGSGGSTGGGVLVVNGTWNDNVCTLNKTWQEIYDGGFGVVEFTEALLGGKNYCPIVDVKEGINEYNLTVIFLGDTLDLVSFSASSASGYPSYTDE